MTGYSRIVFFLLFFALGSCMHNNATTHTRADMPACQASCLEQASKCSQRCNNNCQQCSAQESRSTVNDYIDWKQGQLVQGKVVSRELNSFRDPLQCRKTTCNCSADYNVCIQSCGGVIRKQLYVAPLC